MKTFEVIEVLIYAVVLAFWATYLLGKVWL